jgi:signal transduction histidine kinase
VIKPKISIYTRLVFWITLMVCLLFGAVLFVIQKREAQTLFEETKSRAFLQAKHIADATQPSLARPDQMAIQSYADDNVRDDIYYIVFYDRDDRPYVISSAIRDRQDLFRESRIDSDVTRDDPPFSQERNVAFEGRELRLLEVEKAIFLPGSETKWASVMIGLSLEPMYDKMREIQKVLLLIGAGGFLLGILGAAFLARRITRPIHRLVDGTVRISRGDFQHTIAISSRDEIGGLARSFNEMSAQLWQARERMEDANRKLVQHEKLASIGRMAATIAHEIRNPLTSVKLNIQKVAEEEGFTDVVKAHLGLTLEGIDQIERFVKELLNFTRVQELSLERFPVDQVIEESLKLLKDTLAQKRIVVERTTSGCLPNLLVDGEKMRQVFLNVLRNSQEAVEAGGRIVIATDAVEEDGRTKVRVRISDNGPGIPEKDWETIFEPFFSTKPSGFGLGLANARKIVEQHNGSIRVAKKRGRGSAFVILIPTEDRP